MLLYVLVQSCRFRSSVDPVVCHAMHICGRVAAYGEWGTTVRVPSAAGLATAEPRAAARVNDHPPLFRNTAESTARFAILSERCLLWRALRPFILCKCLHPCPLSSMGTHVCPTSPDQYNPRTYPRSDHLHVWTSPRPRNSCFRYPGRLPSPDTPSPPWDSVTSRRPDTAYRALLNRGW